MSDKLRTLIGDSRETLRSLPKKSVQTVITSPPYYGLRDYGEEGQIGLEETPDEYVQNLVDVFREVRRVLRDDGTVWLNLGDSYNGSGKGAWDKTDVQKEVYVPPAGTPQTRVDGLKPKDLIGIPWRVAFALQADGWYLRQDIIWHKPNPMPESITDRCTKSHEYLFFLSKSARYYYDAEAVKEHAAEPDRVRGDAIGHTQRKLADRPVDRIADQCTTRNRRSVWTIATQPYSGAHFATFPPKLIEPCILAGTPEKGCCPHCGAPWERVVDRPDAPKNQYSEVRHTPAGTHKKVGGQYQKWLDANPAQTTGHRPTCSCPEHEPVPSTVLDPFGGSGTTAGVALEHGRKAILCELSDEYAKLIPDRVNSITDAMRQGRMF